jgi:hypothetical protein
MVGPSQWLGKCSNIYIDVLGAIFDDYYSAWGCVGDVYELEGPT